MKLVPRMTAVHLVQWVAIGRILISGRKMMEHAYYMYITYIYIGVIRTISATAGDENLGIFHIFFRPEKITGLGDFRQ